MKKLSYSKVIIDSYLAKEEFTLRKKGSMHIKKITSLAKSTVKHIYVLF